MIEVVPAIDLPPSIANDVRLVREEGVAIGLPLRPVARVVRADDAVWTGHADEGAEPDERAGEPARRRKAAVDPHAMIADNMTKQHPRTRRYHEAKDCRRRHEKGAG